MEKSSAEQEALVITLGKEKYPSDIAKKVISEMISSYLLVFVACGVSALSRSADEDLKISKLGASAASGLIVTVMIYSVGHISGAHMNPAVTLAFAAVRHFPWKQVPFYAVAQLSGSICASLTLNVLLHPIDQIGITKPSGTELQAFIMEFVATFVMMFVTSAVATDTKAVGELAGIAVGSSVFIASTLAGPISGGSMNPARTLGPAMVCNYYEGIWIYVVGPISGTLMGAWAYNFIRLSDGPAAHSFKIRRSSTGADQPLLLPSNNNNDDVV